jgi:hypothetical protein
VPKPKAKKTAARGVFEINIERSKAFLRIFDKERKPGAPTSDEKELLRGSLVFAVAALDAYLSDLILEVVPKYQPKTKRVADALKGIARSDPGLALRVALAPTKADSVSAFQEALGEWLALKSFQGPDKVVEALGYVACPISWDAFDVVTGANTAKDLEKITSDRHGIVHKGKRPYIVREQAGAANNLVAAIVSHIDSEVCKLHSPT